MRELEEIKEAVSPTETLLVVDAMTGQEAVNVAEEFHSRIGLTGLVLTKLNGDARGGAALSVVSVTDVPIKFIGTGERVDALEEFHPDRLAINLHDLVRTKRDRNGDHEAVVRYRVAASSLR